MVNLEDFGIEPAELDSVVQAAETPVLVDFWAPWCGTCKLMAPSVAKLADEKSGELKVVTLNVEGGQEVALKHNVMSLPTMIIFSGNREVTRLSGMKNYKKLVSEVENALS